MKQAAPVASSAECLRPYLAYDDTSLQWLGMVPAHWRRTSIRAIARVRNVRGRQELPLLSVYREYGVILRSSRDDNHNNEGSDLSTYKVVRPGDLVLNKMKTWQGSLGVSNAPGIVSPAYIVCELSDSLDRQYIHELLRSRPYIDRYNQISFGVRIAQWDMRFDDFKQIPIFLPPIDEQQQIARFLVHADRRINRYIRAKRRLIELLNEQKQAIIHQAVTRGLDPNVPLKPSGGEWLGDIPEHWTVSRLKFEATHIVDCLHATPEYVDDGEYPAIRTADIEPGKVRLAAARRVARDQYLLWTSRLTPRSGDILYSREGERYGIAAVVPQGVELCISQRMMIFRIDPAHCSEFFMWQLNCPHVYAQAAADQIGATAPHVNVETIKNYTIVVPPRIEQDAIARWISQESERLDATAEVAHREIDLIREYRTRLIADVVTGKLDVRGVGLPELDEDDLEEADWNGDVEEFELVDLDGAQDE